MCFKLLTLLSPALWVATLAAMTASPVSAQGTPLGFEEEFALATDRAQALEELLPGTEEYYFYHCLHLQNEERLAEVPALLATWIQRHGRSARVVEIENRQALLSYDQDPAATFEFLRNRLGLRFDDERQARGSQPDLPTRLEPSILAWQRLARRALQAHPGTFNGFRDSALERLAATQLDEDHLGSLLARLRRPDVPNLAGLVVRHLESRQSRGFGSLAIHGLLLLDQLEECLRLRPALLADGAFINSYLGKLSPSPDSDWRSDESTREAWLDRLQAFAERLSPAHNSLKAHVLHHRLRHDLAAGRPSRERLLAYLRLPRPVSYVHPRFLRSLPRGDAQVDLNAEFPTGLGPIGDDETLVRSYLEHFLREADSYDAYQEYLREEWLKRVFAETKILAGIGDMERWYSMLDDPAYYEQLKQRVEIEFDPTQTRWFGASQPVALDLNLKNVGTLIVKVFEIDTFNWYRETGREVDASIEVDGLVAGHESTLEFEQGQLRRFAHRLELPSLAKPGVYVVELIGNGLSSRAVIHKGRLQLLERRGSAGHAFRVLNEQGRQVRDATLWFEGSEFRSNTRGEIVLPYTTEPGTKSVIARRGNLCVLESFEHRGEHYRLEAGIYVDREALVARESAQLLLRPSLLVNGQPVALSILEDSVLTITAVDLYGTPTVQEIPAPELLPSGELAHEFVVPENLSVLTVTLRGRVRSLTHGETIDVATPPRTFQVNAMEVTALTACPLLGRTAEGYVLDLLGKDGEPKAGRAIQVSLTHEDFTDSIDLSLQTDARGRVWLGALQGITSLHAAGFPSEVGAFDLRKGARTLPQFLHGIAGDTLHIPYTGTAAAASRAVLSLLELRGGSFAHDSFDSLAIAGGFIELRGLTAGDYDLWLKETDHHVQVRVTAGEVRSGWALGGERRLELGHARPLALTDLAIEGEGEGQELVVTLANAGKETRVHLVATRYVAAFDPFASLYVQGAPQVRTERIGHASSTYHSGRDIGEEYRYILERRFVRKFPGNMLKRPGLLLNPWALEETVTAIGAGGGAGGRFAGKGEGAPGGAAAPSSPAPSRRAGGPGAFASLEFLPEGSRLMANLRPDENGIVRVPLADLGQGQLVHVLAVDRHDTIHTTLARPETSLVARPRHLAHSLDPERSFAEQRSIELVQGGASAVLEDVSTAEAEAVDSLASVMRQYQALTGDEDLAEFTFVLRWPELSAQEKRELYSKHACHELHFFLHEKDPEFFEQVIRPYLAHKVDKTFLDDWLLKNELEGYLEPWAFARLNVVEKILLSRRIDGQSDGVARHVGDLCDLLPPDPERRRRLFETALAGLALGSDPSIADEVGAARSKYADDEPSRSKKDRARRAPGDTEPPAMESLAADFEVAEEEQFAFDADMRSEVRELFRMPDRTRRYVENNYWHRRIQEQDGSLIQAGEFWRDWAEARGTHPFLSDHYAEATGSFAEMMLALAVLDLPFQSAEHRTTSEERRFTLHAASPLMFVRKEIREADPANGEAPILIGQNYFRLDERFRWDGNQQLDAWVSEEFLVDVAYGCQVVVTNPTSTPRDLELLLQVPAGAIPVQRGFLTRGTNVRLEPYATSSIEYAFYFPAPGSALHYPVQVTRDGEHLAAADPTALPVVAEPTRIDMTSWDHVSQDGTPEEVLRFLEQENLQRVDLARIAWRMKERSFFDAVLARLRKRHVYQDTLWSYGLFAGDPSTAREYLRHAHGFLAQCGRSLASPLVTLDPVERRDWEIVEYEPLFNPRAHPFGRRREILNADLAAQYRALLEILAYHPELDDEDWITTTYYLLLQDRVEEALEAFARVNPESLDAHLQYDYMRAYLDFFTEQHANARAIAAAHKDHPVERWRTRFRDVLNQLDEAEGASPGVGDEDDRSQRQTRLAASEPALELEVESRRITLRAQNIEGCELRYHEMDVEFLFSTQPFVQQGSGSFAYVRPNRVEQREIPASGELSFELPEDLRNSNVLIEVRASGLVRRQAHYANSLGVRVVESYGQLQVSDVDTGEFLPKVYVKVYAREPGGGVRFHKDGYTDLRGRFDYVSLSGEGAGSGESYALLVLSEERGAVIREAAPPTR